MAIRSIVPNKSNLMSKNLMSNVSHNVIWLETYGWHTGQFGIIKDWKIRLSFDGFSTRMSLVHKQFENKRKPQKKIGDNLAGFV